ncbi:MAG: hypothetical protein AB7U85_09780 [Alphaproteobacteria bacterium]
MGIDSSNSAATQMAGIRRYMALNAVKQTATVEAMAPMKAMEQAVENAKDSQDNNVPVSAVKGQNLDITV